MIPIRRRIVALVLLAPLLGGVAEARDVYKGFLDPGIPHHKATLDTLALLEKTPNDSGLHNDLACLIALDGFWRDALREFDTAAKLDKKDSRPLFNAGLVRAWKGEWGGAKSAFGKAVDRNPGNWAAWWMLGLSREKLGDDDGAVAAYKTSLRVDTSLFDVRTNPFAPQSSLKPRVLLETYEKRLVRAALPRAEQLADADRIATFFQRKVAAEAPATEAPVSSGPVVTTLPPGAPPLVAPSASGPPAGPAIRPVGPRGSRGRPGAIGAPVFDDANAPRRESAPAPTPAPNQ